MEMLYCVLQPIRSKIYHIYDGSRVLCGLPLHWYSMDEWINVQEIEERKTELCKTCYRVLSSHK